MLFFNWTHSHPDIEVAGGQSPRAAPGHTPTAAESPPCVSAGRLPRGALAARWPRHACACHLHTPIGAGVGSGGSRSGGMRGGSPAWGPGLGVSRLPSAHWGALTRARYPSRSTRASRPGRRDPGAGLTRHASPGRQNSPRDPQTRERAGHVLCATVLGRSVVV